MYILMKLTEANERRALGIPDGKTLTIYRRQSDGSWNFITIVQTLTLEREIISNRVR
jgi:hypothetical protein